MVLKQSVLDGSEGKFKVYLANNMTLAPQGDTSQARDARPCAQRPQKSAYNFHFKTVICEEPLPLSQFNGKVILIPWHQRKLSPAMQTTHFIFGQKRPLAFVRRPGGIPINILSIARVN
jgi:hypothetical protein